MAISLEMEYRDEILHVMAVGEYTVESAKTTFVAMLDRLVEHNAQKVLIDCRPLKNHKPSIMQTFNYAETAAEELCRRRICPRLAYLYTPENYALQRKFGEDVAVNRGVDARVFCEYEAALAWLREE